MLDSIGCGLVAQPQVDLGDKDGLYLCKSGADSREGGPSVDLSSTGDVSSSEASRRDVGSLDCEVPVTELAFGGLLGGDSQETKVESSVLLKVKQSFGAEQEIETMGICGTSRLIVRNESLPGGSYSQRVEGVCAVGDMISWSPSLLPGDGLGWKWSIDTQVLGANFWDDVDASLAVMEIEDQGDWDNQSRAMGMVAVYGPGAPQSHWISAGQLDSACPLAGGVFPANGLHHPDNLACVVVEGEPVSQDQGNEASFFGQSIKRHEEKSHSLTVSSVIPLLSKVRLFCFTSFLPLLYSLFLWHAKIRIDVSRLRMVFELRDIFLWLLGLIVRW